MQRELQTPQRKAKSLGPFYPTSLWPPALLSPHNLPSRALNPSTAGSAGSAGTHAFPGDTHAAAPPRLPPPPPPAYDHPASMPWLDDPHLRSSLEIPPGLPALASLPCLPDTPIPTAAHPHHRPSLTSPQTNPHCSQVVADGFTAQDPLAALVQLRPLAGGMVVPTPGGNGRADDSVAITRGHRQTWDCTQGPLHSFRALCQTQQQRQLQRQQQQQQLLVACHRRMHRSAQVDSSGASLFDVQQKLQRSPAVQVAKHSSMTSLSSQQPSLSHVTHMEACIGPCSSSASQPYSPASLAHLDGPSPQPARSSSLHELLLYCDSQQPLLASALGPQHPPRFLQSSSSLTKPALLFTLPPPGPQDCALLCTHTSSSESQLSPPQQPSFRNPQKFPSPVTSPLVFQDDSCFTFFPTQEATQSASLCTQPQIPQSPSASRAASLLSPWRTPEVSAPHGSPLSGATLWSPDAVAPDNSIKAGTWRRDPRLGVQDGRTWQKGEQMDPHEQSTMEWMAFDLLSSGGQDTSFHL
ncbi:hypothetical protein ABBQ32_005656 [Trebouxia sp. C0010 RCD-2024]